MNEKYYSVTGLAREVGLSRTRIHQLIREKRIKALKVSGRYLLNGEAVRWIKAARRRGELNPPALPTTPKRCPRCRYDLEEHAWKRWRERETKSHRRTRRNGAEVDSE